MPLRRLSILPVAVATSWLFTVGLPTNASAQITPSADAYTRNANPGTDYGPPDCSLSKGCGAATYTHFDLSSIPASVSVTQATLKLYVNAVTTQGAINVRYVNGAWAEDTITSILAPAHGALIASNAFLIASDKNQYVLVNVTPAAVAWLNGSEANKGLELVADGAIKNS
jgi:hypothetical protein